MANSIHSEMQKGLDLINEGVNLRIAIWQSEILFSWRWWFGVALVICFWGGWILFRKKNSSDRLLYAGLWVMVISLALDSMGMQVKLWHYLYPIFPLIPAYLPYDLALMPVSIMSLIQFKPAIKPIYKAVTFSMLSAFVGEPFFNWLDIYDPINWKYIYSVPFYILIYLTAAWLSKRPHFEKL